MVDAGRVAQRTGKESVFPRSVHVVQAGEVCVCASSADCVIQCCAPGMADWHMHVDPKRSMHMQPFTRLLLLAETAAQDLGIWLLRSASARPEGGGQYVCRLLCDRWGKALARDVLCYIPKLWDITLVVCTKEHHSFCASCRGAVSACACSQHPCPAPDPPVRRWQRPVQHQARGAWQHLSALHTGSPSRTQASGLLPSSSGVTGSSPCRWRSVRCTRLLAQTLPLAPGTWAVRLPWPGARATCGAWTWACRLARPSSRWGLECSAPQVLACFGVLLQAEGAAVAQCVKASGEDVEWEEGGNRAFQVRTPGECSTRFESSRAAGWVCKV